MTSTTRASSPTLVGRREELARLETLLDRVRSGSTATALIAGEAGIGKTRLIDELAQRAAALDAIVLGGGCIDLDEEVLPYAPFAELLSALVRSRGVAEVLELAGPASEELIRLAPALSIGTSRGAAGPPAPPYSWARTGPLYQALLTLFENLARRRAVLVAVEDLHWADRSTLDLLALLARHLRGRILLLLTFRTEETAPEPGLRHFAAELERAGAQRIALGPLGREDQARQLSGILGVPPSPALLERIYRRAEGNPFFAEELVALNTGDDLPPTVRDLLLARLEELPPSTLHVLRAAAAVGRRVTHRLLAAVTGLADAPLDDALRPAVGAHVLVASPAGGGTYRFRHALLREAVVASLLPAEAVRLHRRIAETLTADHTIAGDIGGRCAGRLARHWHAAGDPAQALRASCDAGAQAAEALAFNEALAHYERAIALLDVVPDADRHLPEQRYQLLWSAAEAAHLSAQPHRAAELIRAAIAVVDQTHPHHPAYLHERLGRYLWMSADGEGALQAYERAMALDTDDVSCWRAAIISGYAQILMLAGRNAESQPWCEEAIALAQQVDNARATEGHARNNLGVNLASLGDVDAGIEQLALARRIAEEEFEDVDDIARAIVNLHAVLFDAGRYDRAAQVAVDGIDVVDRLGLQRRKGVWCRCDAAETLATIGRVGEAAALVAEARSFGPEGVDLVRVDLVEGLGLLRAGTAAQALPALRSAYAGAQRLVDTWLLGALFGSLVEAVAWTGDVDEALALATEALGRMGDEHDPYAVQIHAAATFAAAQASAAGSAGGQVADEWVTRARVAVAGPVLPQAPLLALLATAEAERSRAVGDNDAGAWSAAAVAWTDLGDRHRAAYARWREAESALAAGDRGAATQALRTAQQLAGEAGAQGLLTQIATLARRSRLRLHDTEAGRDAAAGPYRLTGREREVLTLLVEGRTDRQIGQQLFISHRTAERHVANILAKFGAATRSEVVAVAHRSGLVDA
jgi:DNA-binding CsgD family transcriptional regulator